MPKFSQTSLEKLATCHQDLQMVMNKVIERFDCTILEGHRIGSRQDELYRQGKTKLKFPKSKHNKKPSLAVDVAPYKSGIGIDWNDTDLFYYFAGYVKGTAHQMGIDIRWGGDWDSDNELHDQTFFDLPHFERKD